MIYLLAIIIDMGFGIWGALGRPWYWYPLGIVLLLSASGTINTSYIQWLTRCYAVSRLRAPRASSQIISLSFLTLLLFGLGYVLSRFALAADHVKIVLFFLACITVSTIVAFADNMFEAAVLKTQAFVRMAQGPQSEDKDSPTASLL